MSLMYAQMGAKVAGALFDHGISKTQHSIAEMQQKFNNKMRAFSASQELNTLSSNEVGVRDAAIRAKHTLELQSLQNRAAATVGAAAAGVQGGSVRSLMRGLSRSRMQAKFALHQRVAGQARANTQQRRNIALNKVYGQDVSVLPKPSAASALLGLGASVVDVYDSHQPEGSKIADTLAGWGRR